MRSWVVYSLSDPNFPGVVRYVGVTHGSLKTRLVRHLHAAQYQIKFRGHCQNWIRSLLRIGVAPVAAILESGHGEGWEAERRWISLYRQQGSLLTNISEGGVGPLGCVRSAETREKLAAANRGKKQSPELVEKRIFPLRGMQHSLSSRLNMSVGDKQRELTDAGRAKIHEARKNTDWNKKIAAGNKGAYAKRKVAGLVRTRLGTKASEETKERLRLSHLGKKQSLETRAKRSASLKAAWAQRKAGVTHV